MFDQSIVLVAEGDQAMRQFLAAQLEADGARVHAAADRAQAVARLGTHRPSALVLGSLDGPGAAVQLVRRVRGSGGLSGEPAANVPVVMLVNADDELGVLRAFDAGADDVAALPLAYTVLRARLRVLLGLAGRRAAPGPSVWRVGVLELDVAAHAVRVRGQLVGLSTKEFALLHALAADPSRVRTREELLRDVWGFRSVGLTRTLDSHACRLRAKLGVHGDRFVVNVWGVGYRLTDAEPGGVEAVA